MIRGLLLPALFALTAFSLNASPAFSTGFDTPADFSGNFVALKPAGDCRITQASHDVGAGLRKEGPGAVSAIFSAAGQGPRFSNVELSASVRFVDFNAPGFGFWARVPADYSDGCLGLITVTSSDQVRLRIFGAGALPSSSKPGVLLKEATLKSARPLDNKSFYTAVFRTTATPEGVRLELLLRDSLDTLVQLDAIAPSGSLPDTGQVGFRSSSHVLVIDDFTITSP